jgi:hypothetical protein
MRCRIMFAVVTIPGWFAIGATPIATQSPFSYGLFQNSCAPWDGPAIDIRLMREPSQCKRLSGPIHKHWYLARAAHPCRPDSEIRPNLEHGLRVALQ